MVSDGIAMRRTAEPQAHSVSTIRPYRATLVLATLTCLAAPAYVVRWHVGFYPTTLLEAMLVLTFVAFVAESIRGRARVEWRMPYTFAAVLFLLAGVASVVIAPDRRSALGLFRAYLVEPMAFFVVLAAVLRTARAAYLVLAGLALGALVAGLANTVVVLTALRAHRLDLAVGAPVVIYNTPNAVALALVPLIAVAAAVVFHARSPLLRAGAGLFALLGTAASLLSFSRGGYAALAVVAIGVALSHRWRWWLLAAVAAAFAVILRVPLVATRLAHELSASDPNNSLVSRYRLWQATVRMLGDHPILGTGLSGFARSIGPYRGGTYAEQLVYPHNILLNAWTETGLLGVLAFALLLIQAIRTGLRGWRECRESWRPLQLGIVLAMIALIVHGLVDVPYWKNDLSVQFWTLLAVSWAGLRWGGRGRPRAEAAGAQDNEFRHSRAAPFSATRRIPPSA